MAQTFKFMDMVQARAPENTTYNALLQLGNSIGEATTNIRQKNRLAEIARAMQEGGPAAGAYAAYGVGDPKMGLDLETVSRNRSIQDEQLRTQAEEAQRRRAASEALSRLLPENVRSAAPNMLTDDIIKLYAQSRQDSHNKQLIELKRQELTDRRVMSEAKNAGPAIEQMYEVGPDGNMRPRDGFQQAAYTPGQMRPGQTPMDLLTQTQGTPVPGVVVDQTQKINPRHQRMEDDKRIAEEVTAKGGPQKGIPERDIQAYWTNTYGQRPKIGFKYTADGKQEELAGGAKKIDAATSATVDIALKNLRAIEPVIVDESTMAGLAIAQGTNGIFNRDASIALRKAKAASMQLAYALSGKTVTNQERADFAELYMPKPTDPAEIRRAKLRELQKFYLTLYDARKGGMSDNEAADVIRQRIAQGEPDWAGGGQKDQPAVRVNSPDDARKLPKGTRFITPDGREMVR